MSTNFLHKTHSKLFLAALLFIMVSLYSGYHLLQGQRGYLKMRQIESHSIALGIEIDKLKTERLDMEDKVSRLRSPHIDADMLEQQALYFLGPQSSTQIVLQ